MITNIDKGRLSRGGQDAAGTRRLAHTLAFIGALLGVVAGCTTYVEQPRADYPPPRQVEVAPREVYVEPPPVAVAVSVEIRTESDFYEPLNPYGRWEYVEPYGRCWIPARVERDWRPYCNGHWQRTEAGWYWVSDEPWAWATYHYGRWDLNPRLGWVWVPRTEWAPAWVSWHQGGGYTGWAPLHPSARFTPNGVVEANERVIPPRAYVFVEERRFLEPVRPATVVVNNTTIINNTVNITNIKVVNKTVINEGPPSRDVERVSGRTVQSVPVRELRQKTEAPVAARQRMAPPVRENNVPPPSTVRTQPGTRETKPAVANDARQFEKPLAITPPPQTPNAPRPKPERTQTKPAYPPPSAVQGETESPATNRSTVGQRRRADEPVTTTRPQRAPVPSTAPPERALTKPVSPPPSAFRSETESGVTNRSTAGQPRRTEQPSATTRPARGPAPATAQSERDQAKPSALPAETKPGRARPIAAREPAGSQSDQEGETSARRSPQEQKKARTNRVQESRPREESADRGQAGTNQVNKAQKKIEKQPPAPEPPATPPPAASKDKD